MKDELITLLGLFVVGGVLFAGAIFGMIFGGIGDKLFGKKKKG